MNLYKASNQWQTRPPDERFSTLQDMAQACQSYRDIAQEFAIPYNQLKAVGEGRDLFLDDGGGRRFELTNWAFGQLSQRAGAPAGYLRTLPTSLVAQNLNTGLEINKSEDTAYLMYHQNGGLLARSVTTERYARIWNNEICKRLMDLSGSGWMVPPARPAFKDQPGTRLATEDDVLKANPFSLTIKVGDPIAPAGLYASDHDMFAFLVDPTRKIEDGSDGGLFRGFFIWNSEVGSASFGICAFLWRSICGNHIVWDVKDVKEFKVRHIGKTVNERAFGELTEGVKKYAEASANGLESRISKAKQLTLGANIDDVASMIYKMRIPMLTKKQIELAYHSTVANAVDGDPNTAWGMANGMTRVSQETLYTDERMVLDRAAGKVLALAD